MLYPILAGVGLLAMLVGRFSGRLRTMPVSPPLLALLLGVVMGPAIAGLTRIAPTDHHSVMYTATRLLLAIAIMAIALRYPLSSARRCARDVALLLLVVMPAMAAAVGLLGAAGLGLPLGLAAALGATMAPTDPVLASSAVVGRPAEEGVPARLRQMLSLEAGANDGLALPLVLAGVALVTGSSAVGGFGDGLFQVLIGLAVGVTMGWVAGGLMRMSGRRDEMEHSALVLYTVLLAFTVLGMVAMLRGDALVGVFAAGLVYNHLSTGADRRAEEEVDEGLNAFLVLPVFLLFGLVLPWEAWGRMGWRAVVFAVGILFLRRLPWVLLLARPLRLRLREALWMGWYGPVGVAAILYLAHVTELGVTQPVIWEAGTLAVAASTVAHGLTSGLGPRLLGNR